MNEIDINSAMDAIAVKIIKGIESGMLMEKNTNYPDSYENRIQQAVWKKRNGYYLGALMEYYHLIDEGRVVYPSIIYFMFKTALSAERFQLAMHFLEQSTTIVGYHPRENQQSLQLNWYSEALHRAVDNGDCSALEKYAAAFSGQDNYKFKLSRDKTIEEAKVALEFFKETQPFLYSACPEEHLKGNNPYF